MCSGAQVHGYPEILSALRVSDRAGVSAAFGPRKPKSQLGRGMHQEIFRRPGYQQFLEKVIPLAEDDDLSPPLLLAFHKEMVIEAARFARD
eukprot:5349190-Pyramimonas_sp.AAC.1